MNGKGRSLSVPRTAFLFAFFLLFALSISSEATVYRYVDEDGTVTLTDSMESVPKKYRDAVKEIDEDDLDEAGVPFAKTAEEIEAEKKPLNLAIRYVRNRLRGKGKVVAAVSGVGILAIVIVLLAVRKKVLRYVLLFVITFGLITSLIFVSIASVGTPSIKILNKALSVFSGKRY